MLFPSLRLERGLPTERVRIGPKKNASILCQDSNLGEKERHPLYYQSATAFLLEIFSATKSKNVKTWICHSHIFKHFRKYFLKIFLKNGKQTYFHSQFLFFLEMKMKNGKPNTTLVTTFFPVERDSAIALCF